MVIVGKPFVEVNWNWNKEQKNGKDDRYWNDKAWK